MNDRQTPSLITRSHVFAVAFFVAFIFLLYQAALLLAPFSAALIWAAILTLALQPLYRKILALLRGRAGLASLVMTALTLILIIGPAVFLLTILATQAVGLYEWAAEGVRSGDAAELWNRLSGYFSEKILTSPLLAGIDVRGMLVSGLSQFSSGLASQIGGMLKNTALLAVDLVIMIVVLFFFFRKGESYYTNALGLLPFPQERKLSIARKLHDTFSAVINGVFLIALGQGIMTGIGFALFGVSFPVFWGFLAAIAALLPVGGAALVWVPGALYLFLTGAKVKGILLACWGLILVSLPDNFLKPMLIGKKAKLPTLFLFFGILGGLKVYGFLGILFGPLIVTLLTAFLQIYREEYSENGDGK